jgi:GxxExxY protein
VDERPLNEITECIIGCAFRVRKVLGYGFLEKVCQNALILELRDQGLHVLKEHPLKVLYRNTIVGDYVADLVVEGRVLVELKAANGLDSAHVAQCLNYLKATGLTVCLLINFGPRGVQVKRLVSPEYDPGTA